MKAKQITIVSVLSVFIILLTMGFKMMVNPVLGKWQLNTKIEQKIQNGNVLERNEKNYKPGKKSYEFMADEKLMIVDDYGKSKEKKKYVVEGSNIYIGKEKSADNLYTVVLKGNTLTLFRTKSKTKEGKTTIETDELILEKI